MRLSITVVQWIYVIVDFYNVRTKITNRCFSNQAPVSENNIV